MILEQTLVYNPSKPDKATLVLGLTKALETNEAPYAIFDELWML